MAKRPAPTSGKAKAAELRKAQQKADKRRSFLIVGGAALGALVILTLAIVPSIASRQEQAAVEAAAEQPIDGVQEFPGQTANHVTSRVEYPQQPPVGGDHTAQWKNCGIYTEPIDQMLGTHSLEHGAVWIGYQPGLAQDQLDKLTELAKSNSYIILSPIEGLPVPIKVSAWEHQLQPTDAFDPRLPVFIAKYAQSPNAPEPGAPCTGGV